MAYLKTLPQYKETIVVIVGDHEGLASYRQELVGNPKKGQALKPALPSGH